MKVWIACVTNMDGADLFVARTLEDLHEQIMASIIRPEWSKLMEVDMPPDPATAIDEFFAVALAGSVFRLEALERKELIL